MDRSKHTKIKLCDVKDASKYVNDPLFVELDEFDDGTAFEVSFFFFFFLSFCMIIIQHFYFLFSFNHNSQLDDIELIQAIVQYFNLDSPQVQLYHRNNKNKILTLQLNLHYCTIVCN